MPDSQRNVAAKMGVSQATLSYAIQHVAAVKRYPELGAADVTRIEAIRAWQSWEAVKSPNRSRARKTWRADREAKRERDAAAITLWLGRG